MLPRKIKLKIDKRTVGNTLRSLKDQSSLVDFSSNDYLGFSKSKKIYNKATKFLKDKECQINGSTGSRLLSGNHSLYMEAEKEIAKIHNSESALIFNSGFDANIGFFSSVPQRGDLIFYDENIHASIRDGISLSHAKSYKFKHNDLCDLSNKVTRLKREMQLNLDTPDEIYIVTESVFSMDGDSPDLQTLVDFCSKIGAYFIVDEAHALGVYGLGMVQQLSLENKVFARLMTFGKGLGCHGAVFLGTNELKKYLLNFSRSFIYTTALPPHSVATITAAYEQLLASDETANLLKKINYFKKELHKKGLDNYFIDSNSAIQSCIVSGNENVIRLSLKLKEEGFDVKPILSPTVSLGQERLRFCIHSFNTNEDIIKALGLLKIYL